LSSSCMPGTVLSSGNTTICKRSQSPNSIESMSLEKIPISSVTSCIS
jgi:hypothetical protein